MTPRNFLGLKRIIMSKMPDGPKYFNITYKDSDDDMITIDDDMDLKYAYIDENVISNKKLRLFVDNYE